MPTNAEIKAQLDRIEERLDTFISMNRPFSLSAHEKGQILAKAVQESRRTGDKSILKEAQERVNA